MARRDPTGCALAGIIVGGLAILVLATMDGGGDRGSDAGAPELPAPTPEPPPPSAASKLLGGLKVGDRIDAWHVVHVRVTEDKRLEVGVKQGDAHFAVWLQEKATNPAMPPRETGAWALYFGNSTGPGEVPPGAYQTVLEDVARRVEQNELSVGTVPGL
jgi:hypothetical protein